MSKDTLDRIKDSKIIAIIRGIPSSIIVVLTNALLKGGISCVEVTFDHSSDDSNRDTLVSIENISEHFRDRICVGAGTVMTCEQVRLAAKAGAKYIISPNVDNNVIKETKRLDLISIPGAMTATEVAHAYSIGADIVKLFPAGVLGVNYIKALRAPLNNIPMLATGGINAKNCEDFLKIGCIGIGVGGSLVSKKLINEERVAEITAAAEEYMNIIKKL